MPRKNGFTVIELLIVVAIISILAGVLVPNLVRARKIAYDTSARAYSRNVVQWSISWLQTDLSRKTTNLPPSCTDAAYVSEGALAQLPNFVTNCTVLINPNGPGTLGARVESQTGEIFEYFY